MRYVGRPVGYGYECHQFEISFLCAIECRKWMEHGGVILNAASYAALLGSAGSGAYAASKAAVYNLTKTLAAELAPYGISERIYRV